MLGMIVARIERKKRNTTKTTSTTEMIRVNSTSSTEARIVCVRSSASSMSIPACTDFISVGKTALIRSLVSMMFAPGCRRMMISTERAPLVQAATRLFSTSSKTSATSVRWTGAPFW